MRKLVVLVLLSALGSACGGKSNDNTPSGPVAGTIGGQTFSPTTTGDVKALLAGSGATRCTIPNIGSATVKAFAVELTSYANACGDFANASCEFHQSDVTATLLFAKLDATPGAPEPTLVPGTYPIATSVSGAVPESGTVFHLAYAQAIATDATCNGGNPTPLVPAAGGTLRIDSVAGPITGYVSVSFQNASTHAAAGSLVGDFSAPLCAQTADVCGLAALAIAGGGAAPPPLLFCSTTGATCVP